MAPSGTRPSGVFPATPEKPVSVSKRLGSATDNPIATTSFETAEAVLRCRKISRSMRKPIRGASTNTARISAGTVDHPHSTRAWKYIAAETKACAPNARLKTPEVL